MPDREPASLHIWAWLAAAGALGAAALHVVISFLLQATIIPRLTRAQRGITPLADIFA
jgi:hypothetical protein